MSRLLRIVGVALHCSAGFAGVRAIEDFWARPKSQGGAGWKGKGYHIIIELDGTTWYLKDPNAKYGYSLDPNDLNLEAITNGVLGYNDGLIHICTIGGVDPKNVRKAIDTRTDEQKVSLHKALQLVVSRLIKAGKDVTKKFGVTGHRDFSKDQNSNGVIESWERIKECPSWDVIGSIYHTLYSSNDRLYKLPYN